MATGHSLDLQWGGAPLGNAAGAMVFVHGRGADAGSILGLARALDVVDLTWVAPQATHNSWYPYSFLAPLHQNEPWLTSALDVVQRTVDELAARGFPGDRIALCGFSQGACLVSEFLARHPRRYRAALIFTGGVIGPAGTPREHEGRFEGLPVFLGCGDTDPHVPLWRVDETADLLNAMGADVTRRVYPGRPHTILPAEILESNRLLRR